MVFQLERTTLPLSIPDTGMELVVMIPSPPSTLQFYSIPLQSLGLSKCFPLSLFLDQVWVGGVREAWLAIPYVSVDLVPRNWEGKSLVGHPENCRYVS